jgi:hypothetical protein
LVQLVSSVLTASLTTAHSLGMLKERAMDIPRLCTLWSIAPYSYLSSSAATGVSLSCSGSERMARIGRICCSVRLGARLSNHDTAGINKNCPRREGNMI